VKCVYYVYNESLYERFWRGNERLVSGVYVEGDQ
jgi:hypothetical protein